MKLKNVFLIVAISIATSLLSVWGYGTWLRNESVNVQNDGKSSGELCRIFRQGRANRDS
jgi:hypothetical protein